MLLFSHVHILQCGILVCQRSNQSYLGNRPNRQYPGGNPRATHGHLVSRSPAGPSLNHSPPAMDHAPGLAQYVQHSKRRHYNHKFKMIVVQYALQLPEDQRIKPTARVFPGVEPVSKPASENKGLYTRANHVESNVIALAHVHRCRFASGSASTTPTAKMRSPALGTTQMQSAHRRRLDLSP